jgi:hypothetical protein
VGSISDHLVTIGEWDTQNARLQNQVVAAAKDLAKVHQLVNQLNETLAKLPNFTNPAFQDLEKVFLAHCKGVVQDFARKQNLAKSTAGQDLEGQFTKLQQWYERKTDAIKIIITGCVCAHKLAQGDLFEDDAECFDDLLGRVKRLVEQPSVAEDITPLLASGAEPFGPQNPALPVVFPFAPEFALQEDGGKQQLFGVIPCETVTYPSESILPVLVNFCNSAPCNSHVYVPKIICMLRRGPECIVVFESVPHMSQDEMMALKTVISEDHKKAMFVGLAGIVEWLARQRHTLFLNPSDLRMTRACQVFIRPSALALVPTSALSNPFTPLSCHPDTVIRPNFALVYVGWLIEMLAFGTAPSKNPIGGAMNRPKEEMATNSFTHSLREVLGKLYCGNTDMSSRPVDSAVRLISNMVHASSTACIFSPAAVDSAQVDTVKNLIKEVERGRDLYGSVDVGSIDRKVNPLGRFDNYVQKLYRANGTVLTNAWTYSLPNERDTTAGGGGAAAAGIGPCKALIADFFELALEHRLFDNVNGKLMFATANGPCKACSQGRSAMVNCTYFGANKALDSLARATQLALVLGVTWPKPFALCTLTQICDRFKTVTQEMCFDVFPLAKKLLMDTEIYGPVQKTSDGEIMTFQLGNVEGPFGVPHHIDLDEHFPILKAGISVPVNLVPLYLMEFLQTRMTESVTASSYFRSGLMAGGKIWTVFTQVSPSAILPFMCETSDYIDPVALLSKLNFDKGFVPSYPLGPERRNWFSNFLSKKENNYLRRAFLKAATSQTTITPAMADGSIKVMMSDPDAGHGNPLHREYGGVKIASCFGEVKLPYFATQEECEVVLLSVVSIGEDYFTTL